MEDIATSFILYIENYKYIKFCILYINSNNNFPRKVFNQTKKLMSSHPESSFNGKGLSQVLYDYPNIISECFIWPIRTAFIGLF